MKKFLSLVLALVMTMSLVTISAGAKTFSDDDAITYSEAAEVMKAIKVVDGYADGSFNPTATLTRGAAAKIICNLILGPTTAGALKVDAAPYKDVPASNTFAGYIAYCQKTGIISGYADGTFRPAAPLTGYAFMKMLLGALGYDADIEGYVGTNWSINVAKRALNLGLDDDLVGDFDGTKTVNREEACLYALNMIQCKMVEYGSKTTVSVGGAEVVVAGSAAKETDSFMSEYFPKLAKTKTTDAFYRPAVKWTLKNEKIGTYVETPDVSYTKSVNLGEIYSDLGLSDKTNAVIYVDGNAAIDAVVAKNNTVSLNTASNKTIGNGTTVDVYYNKDAKLVTIVGVNNYVGEVTQVKGATAAKDAYIRVTEFNSSATPLSTYADFETDDEFEVEDIVLFTYSNKDTGSIESVKVLEGTSAVLNTIYKTSKLTLDGTTISYAQTIDFAQGKSEADLVTKGEYTYYLDDNGYIVYIVENDFLSGDYAFVEANQVGTTWQDNMLKLVYTDGTSAKVVTDKDYAANVYDIVTYKTNSKNETLVKTADNAIVYADGHATTTDARIAMKTGVAKIQLGDYSTGYKTVYADSNTIVVVKNTEGKYHAYTGVKNMPTINGSVDYAAALKKSATSNIAKIIFVDVEPGTAIVSGSADLTYFAEASMSKYIKDTDLTDYYTFNVVKNGVITTMKVEADYAESVKGKAEENLSFNEDSELIASDNTGLQFTDIKKLSGDHTISFNVVGDTWRTYTVADDVKVFFIDAGDSGSIETGTVREIADCDYDGTFVLDSDGEQVTNIFVIIPKDTNNVTPTPVTPATIYTATLTENNGALEVAVTGGASTDSTTEVKVKSVTVTNLNSGLSSDVTGAAFASTTKLTGGALTAKTISGVTVVKNGLNKFTVVLTVGTETVTATAVF